ncbi:PP2C family protein-serine/threonine phosphatase [Paenibacillus shenyangensis]|uniref:PP2C family protein-serine/threonine phosphatase n=1 Tax=Paenibacillus sp. A9 TaxID=1284352 RepID=UPI00037039DA|nr:fused response regulator/phosphatase [Paenibacillus sp. A9]
MSSILIVDDSKLNVAFMENVLRTAGYEDVQKATSAEEAYQILGIYNNQPPRKAASVDLILLDIVMPEIDGIQACTFIKSLPVYQDLPIIFLTADRVHFKEAFGAGGMDFIEKGGPDYELLARVQSAIRLKKEMDSRKAWEEKVQKDLQLAKHLQNSVLTPPLIEPGIQIHSSYFQSSEVSGDMFYWKMFNNRQCGVLLIDVPGSGIAAALISMSIRSLLDGIVGMYRKPKEVCAELNRQMRMLFGKTRRTAYFTAIYMLIDLDKKQVEYFNAGHTPGMLLASDGPGARLNVTTDPVGMNENVNVNTQTLEYDDATRIVLYTNGLISRPGSNPKVVIGELEQYAHSLLDIDNEKFLTKLARLSRNQEDLCIVSINLDRTAE